MQFCLKDRITIATQSGCMHGQYWTGPATPRWEGGFLTRFLSPPTFPFIKQHTRYSISDHFVFCVGTIWKLEYTSVCKLHAPYMGSVFVVVRDAFIVVQILQKQVCMCTVQSVHQQQCVRKNIVLIRLITVHVGLPSTRSGHQHSYQCYM